MWAYSNCMSYTYVYMAHFIANQYNCCPSASVLKIWPNSNVRISFFSPATSTKSIHSFVYCCAYTHFLLQRISYAAILNVLADFAAKAVNEIPLNTNGIEYEFTISVYQRIFCRHIFLENSKQPQWLDDIKRQNAKNSSPDTMEKLFMHAMNY